MTRIAFTSAVIGLPGGWLHGANLAQVARAARVEWAPSRYLSRAGDLALQVNRFSLHIRRTAWNSRQQSLSVGMKRRFEQSSRIAHLHQGSQIHHRDLIRQVADHCQVVRDKDQAGAVLALQVIQQVEHRSLHGHIQGGDRLIRYQ